MKRYISPELQTIDLYEESPLLALSGLEADYEKATNEILTNKKGISDDYNSTLWSQMDNGEAAN